MSVKLKFFPERPYVSKDLMNSKLSIFKSIISNPRTQFFYTFDRSELLVSTQNVYEKFKDRKLFVHIGIGGSSLGPEMMVNALNKSKTKFLFINNIDPEELNSQLQSFDETPIKDALFYFVSKSGGTAELMAALAIITKLLEAQQVKPSEYKNYFVFATDPKKSELLTLAKQWDIETLEVPSDVGGRFSALTPVGFLPALFAGLNLKELLAGAKAAQVDMLCEDGSTNPLIASAEFINELRVKQKITQTVLMPYSSKLRSFSFWFAQLWGESLGKKKNRKGELVNTGLTPIVSYGATDQHSLVQLFAEGPNDKAYLFVEVEKFKNDFSLKSPLASNNLGKLSGFMLSELMKAEMEGTIKALREVSRPVLQISIEKNDEFHLAYLIVYFESLTALMGDYLMIDPFDQPGVEAGKIYAFEFLNQL